MKFIFPVLQGEEVLEEHCVLEHEHGHVTLIPMKEALCTVNGTDIQDPIRLTQGETDACLLCVCRI